MKFPRFRKIVEGEERLIIYNGVLDLDLMKKEQYNMDDLYVQLREKNVRSISDVEYAVLEVNGNLSVFTFSENVKTLPIPLIVSGMVNKELLKTIGKSEKWLKKELKKENIKDVKEVYGASLENGKVVIVKTKRLEKK